jgi:ribosomal protein S24E
MSMIEIIRDVKNPLLSRREITCTFKGLAGKLKRFEAAEMISKQFKLEGKIVIPINLKNDTGKPMLSGTFYVYEDEKLAKEHLKAAIFKRMDKAKADSSKTETDAAPKAEDASPDTKPIEEKKEEKK